MPRSVVRFLVALSLLAALAPAPGPARAGGKGRWGFGDNRYFVIDRVCRDGVAVSAVDSNSSLSNGFPSGLSAKNINLGARLYTTSVGLPEGSQSRLPAAQYGPQLSPLITVSMPVWPAPLAADVDNDGKFDGGTDYFDVYMRSEPVFFNQLLTPGQTVVLTHDSFNDPQEMGYHYGVVEDCRLTTITVPVGSITRLGGGPFDAGVMPAGSVNYWVRGVPIAGTIRKSNIALGAGDSFSNADLIAGTVDYYHTGAAAGYDRLVVGVAGTTRASINTAWQQTSGGRSDHPSLSADGRYVAFDSWAANLVTGDTNTCPGFATPGTCPDVFVRDMLAGTTTRVSVSSVGAQGDGFSSDPSISADGRYVAFASLATNLVPGDTNTCGGLTPGTCGDIFVRDMVAGTTTRVSVASGGGQANNGSFDPVISADGRYVAFGSTASNLVPGDTNTCPSYGWTDPGTCPDIFVHDRQTNTTTRVSVSTSGVQPADWPIFHPAISANGRFVVFETIASTVLDGGFDTNNVSDVFLRDRDTDGDGVFDEAGAVATFRVSARNDGGQSSGAAGLGATYPALSADGRYIAFASGENDLTDPAIDFDGNNKSDIFVRDRQANTTRRVSFRTIGFQSSVAGFIDIDTPVISADGRFVAYTTMANDIIPNDANNARDIVIYDRLAGTTTLVSASAAGLLGNGVSFAPALSADGRYVAFVSYANNLVGGDTNTCAPDSPSCRDVFVRYVDRYYILGIAIQHLISLPLIRR